MSKIKSIFKRKYRIMWLFWLLAGIVFFVLAKLSFDMASIALFVPSPKFLFIIEIIVLPLILLIFGIIFVVVGLLQLISLGKKMERAKQREKRAKQRAMEKALLRGPRVVAIGGGTGLSAILHGLKNITENCTAVVTVTDDGGSSGRLVNDTDAIPPGDLRNCLVALARSEGVMEKLFDYRFQHPQELAGHCLGNLLLSGLADMDGGDMATAVEKASFILDIRGSVYPVTLDKVYLCCEMEDGCEITGETAIVEDSRKIKSIALRPSDAKVNPMVIDAIYDSDVILLGPGSLYTSIIPNLLIEGVIDALASAAAPVYYVANIMTQKGETDGYDLEQHIKAITSLSDEKFLDGVILNNGEISEEMLKKYEDDNCFPVIHDEKVVRSLGLKYISLPLVKEGVYVGHDGDVLARRIQAIFRKMYVLRQMR